MRWSLVTRLRLGFVAALILVLVIFGITWGSTTDFARSVKNEQRNMTVIQALYKAQSALLELHDDFPQFIIGDAAARKRIFEEEPKLYAIIESNLGDYARIVQAGTEREALAELSAEYLRYKEARPKFFDLYGVGRIEEAIAWRTLTITPYEAAMAKAFALLINMENAEFAQDAIQDAEEVEQARYRVFVMSGLLLLLLALGYWAALRALRPIRVLRTQAERVVREQLGETIAASASSNEVTALVESFQLMSDRLLARTESLRQSHERMDFLLRATPAVIFSARAYGDYGPTFISENLRAVLGYEPEEFLSDPAFWTSLIHPDERERVLAGLAVLNTQNTHVSEARYRHKDGSWRWMRSEMALIRDASGQPHERVGYWIDITKRKGAEEKLAELAAELEVKVASRTGELAMALEAATAADRVKTEFMANVTHELRTPLNSVIGFAELLKDEVPGPLNAKQAAFAADILASGERLLALVEGILEMSRLEAAGAALEREPVEIGAMLEECVAAHRQAAEARGMTIGLEVAPDAGSAELAPKALRYMLNALLDNAIKFNCDGGTVAVSARRANGALEIAVADTGIGIAQEDVAKLFKPLVQLDAGLARRHGGVGMGLALARRLAELHGGTINVESEPGKSSMFTLRLPIQEKS